MPADPTPPPVPTEALECPQCKITPHGKPDEPHIHLTDFGYVLFTPNHELRDYIEEIREFERTAGRTAAAAQLHAEAARMRRDDFRAGKVGIEYINGWEDAAARIAEGNRTDG